MKAPFNFVPLNNEVFFPDWADKVSHDIPFSDGESGEIRVKIKAHTPIFIRNGHTKLEQDNSFSNINNKFFIPGTSIKGMLRNVLEIMSFGKMSQLSNSRFAFRDLNSREYELKSCQNQIKTGWLYLLNDEYYIENCGKPIWINHEKIDYFFKTKFVDAFKQYGTATSGRERKVLVDSNKTAKYKYNELLKGKNLDFNYSIEDIDGKQYANSGNNKGVLVVTGQPMVRMGKKGKFKEFIFPKPKANSSKIKISEGLWDEFLFQYFDNDPRKMSPDWRYWKEKLITGNPVPVFFRLTTNNEIKDFGLTFLYKLPYKYTVKDLLSPDHKSDKVDLPEVLFGNNEGLKGRIQVGHAKLTSPPNILTTITSTLGSPRASYYPIYLKQKGDKGFLPPEKRGNTKGLYKTYMDKAELSGRKRYPVHEVVSFPINNNENITSKFTPLAGGSEFECVIRFHNLRKVEIGALLSSITFHENNDCFHNIGMGKPYGYGKIKLSIQSVGNLKFNTRDYLSAFESKMIVELLKGKIEWHKQEQIVELFSMASLNKNNGFTSPIYMDLNEFSKAKGSNDRRNPRKSEYLQKASEYYSYKKAIISLAKEDDIRLYTKDK